MPQINLRELPPNHKALIDLVYSLNITTLLVTSEGISIFYRDSSSLEIVNTDE